MIPNLFSHALTSITTHTVNSQQELNLSKFLKDFYLVLLIEMNAITYNIVVCLIAFLLFMVSVLSMLFHTQTIIGQYLVDKGNSFIGTATKPNTCTCRVRRCTRGTCHLPNLTTHLWLESDSFHPIKYVRRGSVCHFNKSIKTFTSIHGHYCSLLKMVSQP